LFRNFSNDIPLEKFTGIHSNEATRLWEEGIDNVDQLADSSVRELYKRTRFDPNRLKGLVGRALLWKYVFGLENMMFTIGLKRPTNTEREQCNAIIREIRLFPFSDIQGLCAYIFSANIEDMKEEELQEKLKNVDTMVKQKFDSNGDGAGHTTVRYLGREVMQQVAYMSPYFKRHSSRLLKR
jgi:hypothetical protein